MIRAILPHRGTDSAGSGAFGAPRGGRTHNGVDYSAPVGAMIFAPASGEITKLGICYSDDHSYRYVEITSADGYRHRVFYVTPVMQQGNFVDARSTVIGHAQNICARYPDQGMTNHVHYEIKDPRGEFVDPDKYRPGA
jgi:murein DD-endopeptidase MepM/ murein hydrolase activator NlpD